MLQKKGRCGPFFVPEIEHHIMVDKDDADQIMPIPAAPSGAAPTASDLTARLRELRRRIATAARRFGREPSSVRLLAVSKTRSVADILSILRAGQAEVGENYAQEALKKMAQLEGQPAVWHFIGPVQSNKTRHIARSFDWVHSVDRAKIAARLNAARPLESPPLNICIQVNIDSQASKSGVAPDKVEALAEQLQELPRLRLRGLMALPAPAADLAAQRRPFMALRRLQERLLAAGHELDTLSMGATHDMEAAIAEGATLVRIGTALFGPRA